MRARQRSETSASHSPATDPQCAKKTSAPKAANEYAPSGMSISDAVRLLVKQSRELKEYFSYYITAKTDNVKIRLRNALLRMVLSALGFVTLAGLLIIASWFLLSGIAGGLGVLFGERLWIGNIAAGLLAVAGLGLGMLYAGNRRMRISRDQTVQKYERRQERQETTFGHNIGDRAAGTVAEDQ